MERFFTKPEQVADLRGGPLERYLELFATSLEDDGYSASTGRFQLQVFGDFSRWLQDGGVGADEITRIHAAKYIQDRDKRRLGKRADAEAALNRITEFLQKLEVVPVAPSKPLTALEALTKEFGNYLLEQRGLSEDTVAGYERMALCFLHAVIDGQAFDPSAISAQNIFRFAEEQGLAQKSKGKDTLNAVRAFLRFAYNRGYVTTDLARVVPRVASWSLASIPKSVSTGQVEKVLSTCDRTTAYGKGIMPFCYCLPGWACESARWHHSHSMTSAGRPEQSLSVGKVARVLCRFPKMLARLLRSICPRSARLPKAEPCSLDFVRQFGR